MLEEREKRGRALRDEETCRERFEWLKERNERERLEKGPEREGGFQRKCMGVSKKGKGGFKEREGGFKEREGGLKEREEGFKEHRMIGGRISILFTPKV